MNDEVKCIMYRKQLKSFFKYEFEEKTKVDILNCNIKGIEQQARDYLEELANIPLSYFVDHIISTYKREPIMAADVLQFSDISDATINVCSVICAQDNTGLCFQDIGKLLLDDNIPRSQTAFNKYGENHIKTAELLGLAFKTGKRQYYLSSTGVAYCKLPDELRDKVLARLILRNKLFVQLVLVASNSSFQLETFLYDLSESTYLRRRTNIKFVINLLLASPEYDFSFLANNIIL